jgi:hypothetical protein
MVQRIGFLLMAMAQALFAVRCLRNPKSAREENVSLKTIFANLPLGFYRTVGALCAVRPCYFSSLFLKPPSN